MKTSRSLKIEALINKGVKIPNPESVEIGNEVDVENISGDRVTIFSGCKIYGEKTWIGSGVRLGEEAPATVDSCQIGPDVQLKGGYYNGAVFLEKSGTGSGAHVRSGTILEEQASAAHTAGLKQTILFPFVTLGSLINFCDIFMAGGTSRKNHSEVGSSYIHFNYTPNQDKATPSLLGDVPHGVMLDQPPIFLGGQGGLVGPCRLAYGTVIAAGSIARKDVTEPNRLIYENAGRNFNIPHSPGMYRGIKRILANNFQYVANMIALRRWYVSIRPMFLSERLTLPLLQGLQVTIERVIAERVQRLKALSEKLEDSIRQYRTSAGSQASDAIIGQQEEYAAKWPELNDQFNECMTITGGPGTETTVRERIDAAISDNGKDYITAIRHLDTFGKQAGVQWLQGIVDETISKTTGCLPSIFPQQSNR